MFFAPAHDFATVEEIAAICLRNSTCKLISTPAYRLGVLSASLIFKSERFIARASRGATNCSY